MKRKYKGIPRTVAAQYGYINEHFAEPLSVAFLARRAGYSAVQFIARFRQFYGTSPKHYIVARRLHRAKVLLLVSDLSAKQIGEKCGFSDEFYFYKLFRRRFGVTPTVYRERLKSER